MLNTQSHADDVNRDIKKMDFIRVRKVSIQNSSIFVCNLFVYCGEVVHSHATFIHRKDNFFV